MCFLDISKANVAVTAVGRSVGLNRTLPMGRGQQQTGLVHPQTLGDAVLAGVGAA